MPHETEIIIRSFTQPVRLGAQEERASNVGHSPLKVWHLAVGCSLAGFLLGLLV